MSYNKTEINESKSRKKAEREKRKSVVTKFDFSAAGAEMMDLVRNSSIYCCIIIFTLLSD